MMRKLPIAMLVFMLMMSSALTAMADDEGYDGGDCYAGPGVNKFAQDLDLAKVYIDSSKIVNVDVKPTIVRGDVETGHSSSTQLTDKPECTMSFDATKLTGSASNTVSAEWYYIYPEAAVLPDGSKKNIKITYKLRRVETSGPANTQLIDGWLIMSNGGGTNKGHNIRGGIVGFVNTSQLPWACQAEMDVSISVVDASGSVVNGAGNFLIPINGVNQWQNQGYKSWKDLEGRGTNKEYTREVIILPNTQYAYPKENINDKNGQTVYGGKEGKEGAVGKDGNYNSGLVTMGTDTFTMAVREIGAANDSAISQDQNIYLSLGDLQHRIWSGSGPNGKIVLGQEGGKPDLDGGSFKGEISGITGEESTLRRYVVPDCKAGMTYTMTPDQAHRIDTVCVDGTSFAVPDDPEKGATWTTELPSKDGGGVLTHVGDGVFTYKFGNANTQDHSIYVSWKTRPAATITFDPNGGSGKMSQVKVPKGTLYKLPAIGFKPPAGKVFNGWDKGMPGTEIEITGDLVLVAQWVDEAKPSDPQGKGDRVKPSDPQGKGGSVNPAPKTGDDSPLPVLFALSGLSALILSYLSARALVSSGIRRRR